MSSPHEDLEDMAQHRFAEDNDRASTDLEVGEAMLAMFKTAVQVCMEQRGHIAFLAEYLPGGIFYNDTEARQRVRP